MDEADLYDRIRVLLAGRCAEEVVFQTKTTGAANDIERATDLARKMVTMFGMSDRFGMMGLATVQSQYLDGSMGLSCAQDTAAQIDGEIRKIIETCHSDVIKLLEDNRDKLDAIALYLLKKETITGAELMAIMEGRDPEESAEPVEEVVEKEWISPRNRKPSVSLGKKASEKVEEKSEEAFLEEKDFAEETVIAEAPVWEDAQETEDEPSPKKKNPDIF